MKIYYQNQWITVEQYDKRVKELNIYIGKGAYIGKETYIGVRII